jgi:hypothetical protein
MRFNTQLSWPVSKQGYKLVELDLSAVNWVISGPENDLVVPPVEFDADAREALHRWGIWLRPDFQGEPDSQYDYEPKCVLVEAVGDATKQYQIFTDPNVFRELANADPTPDGAVKFANRYGLLQNLRPTHLGDIVGSINYMRRLMDLWNAGKKSEMLNELKERPNITELRIRVDNEGEELAAWLEPPDLRTAIQMQLILAAAGGSEIEKCEECPKFIVKAPSGSRPDKKYCSQSCQMRAYRKREKAKKEGTNK